MEKRKHTTGNVEIELGENESIKKLFDSSKKNLLSFLNQLGEFVWEADLKFDMFIHVTTEDDIKVGDWFWSPSQMKAFKRENRTLIGSGCRKIVASTSTYILKDKDSIHSLPEEFVSMWAERALTESPIREVHIIKDEKEYEWTSQNGIFEKRWKSSFRFFPTESYQAATYPDLGSIEGSKY